MMKENDSEMSNTTEVCTLGYLPDQKHLGFFNQLWIIARFDAGENAASCLLIHAIMLCQDPQSQPRQQDNDANYFNTPMAHRYLPMRHCCR